MCDVGGNQIVPHTLERPSGLHIIQHAENSAVYSGYNFIHSPVCIPGNNLVARHKNI